MISYVIQNKLSCGGWEKGGWGGCGGGGGVGGGRVRGLLHHGVPQPHPASDPLQDLDTLLQSLAEQPAVSHKAGNVCVRMLFMLPCSVKNSVLHQYEVFRSESSSAAVTAVTTDISNDASGLSDT